MCDSDKSLSGNPFGIDELTCYQLAQCISQYRAQFNQTPWGSVSQETQLVFKLSVVAICHQINWEFLQNRLAENLLFYQGKNLVEKIANVTARDIKEWLKNYHRPERIRAVERAKLLRDLGRTLQEDWDSRALAVFETSNGQLGGKNGFLQLIDCFSAYRDDSLRKKSNFLVHDVVRERILSFMDMENIKPAIDYHIMRLYLRTGKVIPRHKAIFEQLKGFPRPRARLVRLLRSTVADALCLTANYSKLTIPDVNYVDWQLGRSICINEQPLCVNFDYASSIAEDVAVLFSGRCPYEGYCRAFTTDREWFHLQEPRFEKSYY